MFNRKYFKHVNGFNTSSMDEAKEIMQEKGVPEEHSEATVVAVVKLMSAHEDRLVDKIEDRLVDKIEARLVAKIVAKIEPKIEAAKKHADDLHKEAMTGIGEAKAAANEAKTGIAVLKDAVSGIRWVLGIMAVFLAATMGICVKILLMLSG